MNIKKCKVMTIKNDEIDTVFINNQVFAKKLNKKGSTMAKSVSFSVNLKNKEPKNQS